MTRSLTLDDIVDNAAYEDERDEFRTRIIALKKRRRIGVGEFVTLVFENRETMRFQIQEMARVERMDSDAAIEGELAVYNKLIPEPGSLSATLFIELTSDEDLRSWLPKLVGIEKSIELRLSDGTVIVDIPEADHEALKLLRKAGRPVDYVTFRGDGHGNQRWQNNLAMYRKTEDFLAQCLGGRSGGLDYYQLVAWAF